MIRKNGKLFFLVHDTKPLFLDGRIVFTKQAKPIMPIKDSTSDMAILSCKGSALVCEIREKQRMNKSRQRFWELSGSRLGDNLGVEKSSEQIDADTAMVGEAGEVDFKEDARFAQHLKKGEAVSDFAKSNTIAQQRQYLPIFSIRDELLQVIRENQVVVVVGETGSGKTKQLTQYLHEDEYTMNGIVDCTQPRHVDAMSVAKRVSEEMETELADKVGYAIHFEDVTGPNTVIKYMTGGVLLWEMLKDSDLDKYLCRCNG